MKKLLLLACFLISPQVLATYISFVKPIEQRVIEDPRGGSASRFEGCGPIAAAMLLSYWETERDYKIMSENHIFNGSYHPAKTIKEFYKASWTQRAPATAKAPDGKKYAQSFTLPNSLVKGLKKFVVKANSNNTEKLIVKRFKARNHNDKKIELLEKLIREKKPVISLIHNIPACLNSKDNKSGGWHYVVIVGVESKTRQVNLISGWKELDSISSTSQDVHQRNSHPDTDKAHIKCSYEELIKANPAFYWIEEDAS